MTALASRDNRRDKLHERLFTRTIFGFTTVRAVFAMSLLLADSWRDGETTRIRHRRFCSAARY